MRVREKNTVVNVAFPGRYSDDGSGNLVLIGAPFNGQVTTRWELLEDNNNKTRRPDSYCRHLITELSNSSPRAVWDNYSAPFSQRLVTPSCGTFSGGPSVTSTIANEVAIRDTINANISTAALLPVSFKELPQLKSTYETLLDRKFGVKKFANKYLAYKFGILPFLSDLKALATGWDDINNHIEMINLNQGKVISRTVTSGTVSGEYSYFTYNSLGSIVELKVPWTGYSRMKVRTRVVRRYTDQDKINAYCDYYGASFAKVGWELIPYSFVCDWFVDVGSVIELLAPKNQVPMAALQSACNIVRASANATLFAYDKRAREQVAISNRTLKYFVRTPGVLTPNSISGGGLTLSRATIAGALLLQKL